MRPIWLIEAGVYREEVVPLVEEIQRQGMMAEVTSYSSLKKGSAPLVNGQIISKSDCVIGYGTYPFARQIQLHHGWSPGAWCSDVNLNCANYYAYFGRYLLNQNYVMLPGVEAIRQRDWLLSRCSVEGRVFERPTSCQKIFVGRCMDEVVFEAGLSPTRYDPTTLVVVAAPKPIGREWRLIVVGNEVISGSQYADRGEKLIRADLPQEVRDFANAMLAEIRWRPDPVFMLDVCESNDRLWLVELNSFSSSWLYLCDYHAVVSATSELAEQIWLRQSAAISE